MACAVNSTLYEGSFSRFKPGQQAGLEPSCGGWMVFFRPLLRKVWGERERERETGRVKNIVYIYNYILLLYIYYRLYIYIYIILYYIYYIIYIIIVDYIYILFIYCRFIYIYININYPAPGLPRVCFVMFSRVFMMTFMFISWYLQDL